jgi:pimeloyl-ACP methyl ester carboxylesterase
MKRFLIGLLACLFAASASAQTAEILSYRLFGTGASALVVVLHGDLSDGGPADYHQPFAERIAQLHRGITAAAVIRPGYSDSRGLRSVGSTGRVDHYTRRNNDLVAQTIVQLRRSTGARQVIAVGHSGGAAQLGAVIGRHPGIIDDVVLVSCPCNLLRWRTGRGDWTASESPHRFLSSVPPTTRIHAITGRNDSNTTPALAQDYVAAARSRGLSANFRMVDGAGHGFNSLAATVEQVVVSLLRN